MAVSRRSAAQTAADQHAVVIGVIENKRDKFRRKANQRGKALIKQMMLMGNLGSKTYESAPEQVEQVIRHLTEAFEAMKMRLRLPATKTEEIPDLL